VGQHLVDASRRQHDAEHQRHVQVAVGVARQAGAVDPGRRRQRPLGSLGVVVEVRPPQARDQGDGEEGAAGERPVDGQVAAVGADGDDRFAQRHDDDEAVPLGEVARVDGEPGDARDVRPGVGQDDGQHPQRQLRRAVEAAGDDEQGGGAEVGRRQAEDGAPGLPGVLAGEYVQRQVQDHHDQVREAERHAGVAERARHGQRSHERGRHPAEHDEPRRPLAGRHRVRQPGVAAPRPPQRREHQHAVEQPAGVVVVRDQPGDLRDGEHEHQVEEQLERRDADLAPVAPALVDRGPGRLAPRRHGRESAGRRPAGGCVFGAAGRYSGHG
jgi:hypothetical protein